jgi:hypothetical protein
MMAESTPLDWQRLREGDAVASLDHEVSLTEVVKFIGATWSFVRIFYDPDFARAQGLEGTIVPGPLKLALLCRMLSEWLGDAGEIRSIRCANRRPDRPGLLRCRGTILRRYEAAGETLLDCQIWIENDAGERSVTGAATLLLR